MKNGAPGIENVKIAAITALSGEGKEKIFQKIKEMTQCDPNDWEEECSVGYVVPLHKKGAKNDLNNYRGICLLPLASRIIARMYATRIRDWAEEI